MNKEDNELKYDISNIFRKSYKIFSKSYHKKITIYNCFVKDNYLYLLYNIELDDFYIMKIDIIKRIIIYEKYIKSDYDNYYYNSYLINDEFHIIFKNQLHIYDINCKFIKIIHLNIYNNSKIIIDIKINNDIYYCHIDNNNMGEKKYNIINMYTKILAKLRLDDSEDIYVCDKNILHLPFYSVYITYYNNILYGEKLVIYHIKNYNKYEKCYIEYDLSSKDIKVYNYNIIKLLKCNKFIHLKDKNYYLFDVETKKDLLLKDLKFNVNDYGDCKILYPTIFYIFEHNGNNYYVENIDDSNKNMKYIDIYIDNNIENNIENIENNIENNIKNIKNNIKESKIIKIGTKENNVELPIEYLFERSSFIKNMFSQISEIPDTLLHESLINIDVYKKFIIDKEIVDYYKLYQICNYLGDIDLMNITELIINMVQVKEIEIDEIFKYMEIMSTSFYDNFVALLFIAI